MDLLSAICSFRPRLTQPSVADDNAISSQTLNVINLLSIPRIEARNAGLQSQPLTIEHTLPDWWRPFTSHAEHRDDKATVVTPAGTFENSLFVVETTALEPGHESARI